MATTVRALSLSIAVSTSTGPGVMRCVASLRLTATGVASSRRSLVLLALLRLRPDRDVEYYAGAQSAGHADPRRGWPGVARPAPFPERNLEHQSPIPKIGFIFIPSLSLPAMLSPPRSRGDFQF